jgi:kinesin family protein 15
MKTTADVDGGVVVGFTTTRTTTKASFFEIYNERVYDLLSPNDNNMTGDDDKGLPVREDVSKGVYVEGLYEGEVSNTIEAMDILRCGMANRSVAATNMNRVSSRSHAVFVLTVRSEILSPNGMSTVRLSKFTLVDLAGSERQKMTSADGERLKEASMINNSLLCLGQVINSLVDREKGKAQKHVPFRVSKLTFLLRDSFGGNSKTCLVATVTPSVTSLSETISTLTFAQRAKMITNTAVLNENTCGSVSALQAEIARLRAELELTTSAANSGDPPMVNVSFPPSDSVDVTINALRHQNSKLSKRVEVLGEVSNGREQQINLLKRKLQQETLIRKCKERRIKYLSSNCKTSSIDGQEEINALREEIVVLREQLEAVPTESVEWMLKYKETNAKVEELEASLTNTFVSDDEKSELEASLVSLLNERDALSAKLQSMSEERNTEIDNIIKEVTLLENRNVGLQTQLADKELVINANMSKIQTAEMRIEALQEEMKVTVASLESTQVDLMTEKKKTIELQEAVERVATETDKANTALLEHQSKLLSTEEKLAKMVDHHNQSKSKLNTRIDELHGDVANAMRDNELLIIQLKQASDDLVSTKSELDILEQAKNDAMSKLELISEKSNADLELFKLQEETLTVSLTKMEATIETLLVEKGQADVKLEEITATNSSLLAEVEALKSERDVMQQLVASLDKLHDDVAMLEDEVTFVTIEMEQVEERLCFNEADMNRTIRLHEHLSATQAALHANELAQFDDCINLLSCDKSSVENELAGVSRQLRQMTEASVENKALLEMEISDLQDKVTSLNADLKKAEETVTSVRSNEAELIQRLEQAANQTETVTTERDELQISLNTKITELQSALDGALKDSNSLAAQLNEASNGYEIKVSQLANLEKENAEALAELEFHKNDASAGIESLNHQIDALKADLQRAEETNAILLAEKSADATSLETASNQSLLLSEEVAMLKSERNDLQQRIASLDILCSDLATAEDELEYMSIVQAQMEAKLEFVNEDSLRTSRLLNLREDDLAERDVLISGLSVQKAMLQIEITAMSKQLAANAVELDLTKKDKSTIELEVGQLKSSEQTLTAHVDALGEENKSIDALKVKIDELERENAALREQASIINPPTSSSSSGVSIWEASPIKSADDAIHETAFGGDDTFDESMFLPNVDDVDDDEANAPPSDDSKTPSKTPFKEKRALFSPASRIEPELACQTVAANELSPVDDDADNDDDSKTPFKEKREMFSPKSRKKNAQVNQKEAAKKAETPVKRLTRAMRDKIRTPLGKSTLQNGKPDSSVSTKRKSTRGASSSMSTTRKSTRASSRKEGKSAL